MQQLLDYLYLLKLNPRKPLRMHISRDWRYWEITGRRSWKNLSYACGKPNVIASVAPTGIAAVLINRETVHSEFSLNSKTISKERERGETTVVTFINSCMEISKYDRASLTL